MFAYNRRRFLDSIRLDSTLTLTLTLTLHTRLVYPHCHCHCRDSIFFSEQKKKKKKKKKRKKEEKKEERKERKISKKKHRSRKFSFAFSLPSIIMSSAGVVAAIDGTDYTIVRNLDYVASTYIAVSLFIYFILFLFFLLDSISLCLDWKFKRKTLLYSTLSRDEWSGSNQNQIRIKSNQN